MTVPKTKNQKRPGGHFLKRCLTKVLCFVVLVYIRNFCVFGGLILSPSACLDVFALLLVVFSISIVIWSSDVQMTQQFLGRCLMLQKRPPSVPLKNWMRIADPKVSFKSETRWKSNVDVKGRMVFSTDWNIVSSMFLCDSVWSYEKCGGIKRVTSVPHVSHVSISKKLTKPPQTKHKPSNLPTKKHWSAHATASAKIREPHIQTEKKTDPFCQVTSPAGFGCCAKPHWYQTVPCWSIFNYQTPINMIIYNIYIYYMYNIMYNIYI